VRKLIPYVGAPRSGPRRILDEEARRALSAALAEKQRAAREKTRGLPTGVFVLKNSGQVGRYAAKVGGVRAPGSYATVEQAVQARDALRQKLEQEKRNVEAGKPE
jgi:hypothetical protein